MTIVKYGIDWEVTGIERSINFVTIGIQSDGLHLVGYPNIDLFDGPYLAIKHVVMANNTYSIQQCFRFYAKELTPLYYKIDELTEELTWYTKLHNGYTFPKTLFKPYNDMYRMLFTSVLKWDRSLTKEDIWTLSDMVEHVYQTSSMKFVPLKRYDALVIDSNLYNQLPDLWTINDLAKLLTAELDNIRNIYEQPWCETAERRATHKLIKIPTSIYGFEKWTLIEKPTIYGIILHNILPKNTNYVQPDRSR